MKRENAITIQANGNTVTTAVTSAAIAIPVNANGTRPYYVRIAATNESYIQIGPSTVTATINSMLVQPADNVILAVGGATHIAYIWGTVAGRVNIIPLED